MSRHDRNLTRAASLASSLCPAELGSAEPARTYQAKAPLRPPLVLNAVGREFRLLCPKRFTLRTLAESHFDAYDMSGEQHEAGGAASLPMSPEQQPSDRAEAISTLFREHNRALVNFLLTRLPSEAEAKEVAQEAYVRLLQLDQPVAAGFLRWYLFKIAKGIAVDRHRQRATRERLNQLDVFEDLDVSSPTESSAMASDELALLLSALRELPRKCQQAFLLHRFRDLSTIEVAAEMGLTDRMVRKYVQRALVYCRLRVEGLSKEEAMRQVEP